MSGPAPRGLEPPAARGDRGGPEGRGGRGDPEDPEGERRRARRARLAGFTLIEVVVVLLILAVLAGATVPALLNEGTADNDLTRAVTRIETLFRVARDSAIRSGAPVTVFMDSTTHLVWLVPERVDAATPRAPVDSRVGERGSLTASPAGSFPLDLPGSVDVQLGVTRAGFTFLPTGAAMGDSLIVRRGATEVVLLLDPWTADVVAH